MHQNTAELAVLLKVRKIRVDRATSLLVSAEKDLKIAEDLQISEKSKVVIAQDKLHQFQSERQSFTNKYVAGSELKKRNELLLVAKAELEDARTRHMESLSTLHCANSEYEKFLGAYRNKQKIFVKTEVILEEINSTKDYS